METSTIAILILMGVPLLLVIIFTEIGKFILFVISFLSIIFGFFGLFIAFMIGGWTLFYLLAWELSWISLCIFIPYLRKYWTDPL